MCKLKLLLIAISILTFSQCRSLKDNEESLPPFDVITKEVIAYKINKTGLKTYKDSLVIIVDILSDKDFVNNSKYLLTISADNKKALVQYRNDSIYEFNGMDMYVTRESPKCRDLFNKNFRYFAKDIDKIITFNEADYSQRWETIFSLDIYINDKYEISYLDTGNDKFYYNLLKDKVKFASDWKSRE